MSIVGLMVEDSWPWTLNPTPFTQRAFACAAFAVSSASCFDCSCQSDLGVVIWSLNMVL